MTLRSKGAFFAVLSGFLYGFLGYFGLSVVNADISVPNMLFWRFLISGLFIALVLIPKLPNVSFSKESISTFFFGMAFYGSSSMLYFFSSQYIGSGLAMVVFFTYPALIMLINKTIFRQPIRRIYYLALIIIFIGMLLLVDGGPIHFSILGLFIALLSATLYALYIIFSKNSRLEPITATFWISLGSAFTCLLIAVLTHSFTLPKDWGIWFNLCGIGIICTALPILLLLKGLTHISSLQASIFSVLEPVFVVIFGIILLGEQVNILQGIGVIIMLTGALLTLAPA